jgi:hypothetical protein
MGKRGLKAGDVVVAGVLVALIFFLFSWSFGSSEGGERLLIVSQEGKRYVSLHENREILVEGPIGINRVVIRDGEAWVADAPCKDKICITMGKVKRPGDQVVCLPNHVIIEVVGGGGQIDGVSR